jgi:hypothetical protein
MLEYPKVDGLLVGLDIPRDGIFSFDCDPSDEIALDDR